MVKSKFKILLLFLIIMFLASSFCFATDDNTSELTSLPEEAQTENVTIPEKDDTIVESHVVNSDLYICQKNVTISNRIDGNVYIIGNDVTISSSAQIEGNLFVMANKLIIEDYAYIHNSIYALANEIHISGTVYDIYASCNSFNLEYSGVVYRDLRLLASNANLYGQVYRDAYLSVGNMTINRTFEAVIRGNLTYSSSNEITISQGSVSGEVKYIQSNFDKEESVGSIISSYILDLLRTLLLTFVVAMVLLWLTPKFIERLGKTNLTKSLISLGIGFVAPIGLVLVGIILLITIIGSPVLICSVLSFIVLSYIGTSVTSIFFGKLIANKLNIEGNVKIILFTLASCSIIWFISQIPYIGAFVSYISSIFGVGLILLNIATKKDKIEETKK